VTSHFADPGVTSSDATQELIKACDWLGSVDALIDTAFTDRGWSKLKERRRELAFEDAIHDVSFRDPKDSTLAGLADDISWIQMFIDIYVENIKKSHDLKSKLRPDLLVLTKLIGPFALAFAVSLRLARHTADVLEVLV